MNVVETGMGKTEFKKNSKKLLWKILFLVSASVAAIGLCISALTYVVATKNQREHIENRATQLAKLQASALAYPLWNFKLENVQQLVEDLAADSDFQYATVIAAPGVVSEKESVAAQYGEKTIVPTDAIVVSHDIMVRAGEERKNAGRLELWFHRKGIVEVQQELLFAIAVTMLLFQIVTVGAVALSFRMLTTPLQKLTQNMRRLSRGDLSIELDSLQRDDEVGQISRAVDVFKHNLQTMTQLEKEQEQLKADAEKERQDTLSNLVHQFERDVRQGFDDVAHAAGEIGKNFTGLSCDVRDSRAQTDEVSGIYSGTQENVQMIAAASEQLAASIAAVEDQVNVSIASVDTAVSQAGRANDLMASLRGAVDSINDVVALISDIADQTNLLALNATIEAARAGEAGKGFGVVAEEVKALANQTGQATHRISKQIEGIQTVTGECEQAISDISSAIDQMSTVSDALSGGVGEQRKATEDIAQHVQEVAVSVSSVADAMQNLTGTATKVSDTCDGVSEKSTHMVSQVEKLGTQLTEFSANILK